MLGASLVIGWMILQVDGTHTATRGQICLSREESQGVVNILPARIIGWHRGRRRWLAQLVGGDQSCVGLQSGRWALQARSFRPYEPWAMDPDACRSRTITLTVKERTIQKIAISPRANERTYLCGWVLHVRQIAAR